MNDVTSYINLCRDICRSLEEKVQSGFFPSSNTLDATVLEIKDHLEKYRSRSKCDKEADPILMKLSEVADAIASRELDQDDSTKTYNRIRNVNT